MLTPLVVSRQSISNVIKCEDGYINGSTVRGAILTKCFRSHQEMVKDEIENPKLIFHPLWPSNNNILFKPAHIFIYKCKVCGHKKDYLHDLINDNLELRRIPPRICEQMHVGAMKSLHGELLSESLDSFEPSFTIVDSVGMSKMFRCSEIGMLYSYVCLAPGSTFEGVIVDLSSTKLEQLGLDSEFEVYLGRGASRGLGITKVVIEEVPHYIKIVSERFEQSMERTKPYVVLKSLSPTLLSKWLQALETVPHLHFERIFIAGVTTFSGFSLLTNRPKASVRCVKPGSLVFYNYDGGDYSALSTALSELHLKGVEPFNCLGMNILEVIG